MRLPELPFSFCLFCSSCIRKERSACARCLELLQKRSLKQIKILGNLPVRSIFSWTRDLNPEISQLVTSLKGGENKVLWKPLSESFLGAHWGEAVNFLQGSVLVPVPSKRPSLQDHSFLFAEALSTQMKIPLFLGAKPIGRDSQKRKGRRERAQAQFQVTHHIPGEITKAVIVDDILTTGGTARALIRAIESGRKGPPLKWEIWVLAYRHLSQQHLASNAEIC